MGGGCSDTSQAEVKLSLGANLPTRSQPLTLKLDFTPHPNRTSIHHRPQQLAPARWERVVLAVAGWVESGLVCGEVRIKAGRSVGG